MSAVLRSVFAVSQKPPLPHHGRKRAVFVFAAFLLLTGVNARAQVPVEVVVVAVPIVVTSTTADYFVLYVKHDVDGTEVEIPVLVKRGEAGTTTLSENVEALAPERYRVEKYLVAQPADIDGDGIDDINELGDPVGMNPVNPAPVIDFRDGTVAVPDQETREAISGRYNVNSYLKFVLFDMDTDAPGVYFINVVTHPVHQSFLDAVGLEQENAIVGYLIYDRQLVAPNRSQGSYYYWLEWGSPSFSFEARAYTLIAASMPLLKDNLALYIQEWALRLYESALPLLRASRIDLLFEEDLYAGTNFLALNSGAGYGLLRVMEPDERPTPRDVVIYEALPNELPRVAGIISTVPQTPLSHVNLRAVQDGIPNAFIRGILNAPDIAPLVGGYIRYEVTATGYTLRVATPEEVDAHYEASRPATAQTPQRERPLGHGDHAPQ